MNRRHLLAGAAALPLAGIAADVQAFEHLGSDDPAIDAVRRWLAANLDERAYNDPNIPDDDPRAEALQEQSERLWQEMLDTPPQTAAGLALMLAAYAYETEAIAAGSHFSDPESWFFDGVAEGRERMLPALWRSPPAAELFKLILPADDPIDYHAERERADEAFDKAFIEAQKRPHQPTVAEVRGARIASEAAGKPISEDEAIALLTARRAAEAA